MGTKRIVIYSIGIGLVILTSISGIAKTNKISASDKFEKQLEKEIKSGKLDFYSVVAILEGDVFDAYEGYDKKEESPLQRKVFLKSQDYKRKLAHLNRLKQVVLNTEYYVVEDDAFKKDYNIEEKAFLVQTLYRRDNGESLRFIEQVEFPDFEYKTGRDDFATITYLRLKVSEELALKIEQNKDNYELRIYFKPKGLIEVPGGLYNVRCNTCLTSREPRLVIWDKVAKKAIWSSK